VFTQDVRRRHNRPATKDKTSTFMDLAKFDLNDMIECGRAVRKAGEAASSMEEAADEIIQLLRRTRVDGQTGEANCPLVRCFKTHPLSQLPPDLEQIAQGSLSDKISLRPDLPCLTLLATVGDEEPWNDRRSSRGHAAIPLESVEMVERAPMIASLLRQMGLKIETALNPDSRLILDGDQHTFNVFHVEHAQGNPSIPAQADFVRPYGIRSALGFGGLLPGGDLFIIVMFSRVTIPRETADMFRTIALGVKLALLPFVRGAVFATPADNARLDRTSGRAAEIEQLAMRSEIATLHLLISALEEAALRQTKRLKSAFGELQIQGELAQQQSAREIARAREDERMLQESERRLRLALEAGKMGTWKWDAETDLLDVDEKAAEIFGWSPHVSVTRSALRERAVFAEDRALTSQALTEALKGKGNYRSEYRVVREDGGVIWVHSSGVPVFSMEKPGEVVGMIGTVQDITERRNREATLKQTEMLAATGRMAATIAHEINNPLEAVINLIFLAKTNRNIPDSVRRHLEVADEELARVGQIAQQTLGFYRDTSRPHTLNVAAVISDVIAVFERRLSYKQMYCQPEFRGDLEIIGLQGELRQAISNLLLNAMDASSNGNLLRIRARETRILKTGLAAVSIAVGDSGCGISDSAKRKLFSPFFTTKQSVGTGLGLWVTKGIVEKHGGSIRFRSRVESPCGTVFRIVLPRRNDGLDPETVARANLTTVPASGKRT
jgi:PAS domain S-box-containing protein